MSCSDFETADLAPTVLANVKQAGYKDPTPVQRYGIPVIRQKYDLMACAQTGSGKTVRGGGDSRGTLWFRLRISCRF